MSKPSSEVVEAFTSSAITALQELARIEAFAESALEAEPSGPLVSATIRLQRPVPGMMTLVLGAETALQLAARYLPEGTPLTDDLIDDVAGEFANVIAGQAKTILKGTPYHFTMSPPRVTRGAGISQLSTVMNGHLATSLATELGRVVVLIVF